MTDRFQDLREAVHQYRDSAEDDFNGHAADVSALLYEYDKAAQAAPKWQPIETAPKSELVVVIFDGKPELAEVVNCVESHGSDYWFSQVTGDPIDPPPSHWFPLPEAPKN